MSAWLLVAAGGGGDAIAAVIVARMLGVAIAGYVNVFQPERVVIGGGLSRASHLFFDRAVQEAGARALPALYRRVEISLAQGGPDAGVIGAGLLAEHEIRNTETATQAPTQGTA